MKQYYIGRWWGFIKLLGQHVTSYLQLLILAFTSITAYAEINRWLVAEWEVTIPFWAFILAIIVLVVCLILFEYTLSWPSFFSVWNKQIWEHKNPLKEKLENMQSEISEIKKLLEKNVTK